MSATKPTETTETVVERVVRVERIERVKQVKRIERTVCEASTCDREDTQHVTLADEETTRALCRYHSKHFRGSSS